MRWREILRRPDAVEREPARDLARLDAVHAEGKRMAVGQWRILRARRSDGGSDRVCLTSMPKRGRESPARSAAAGNRERTIFPGICPCTTVAERIAQASCIGSGKTLEGELALAPITSCTQITTSLILLPTLFWTDPRPLFRRIEAVGRHRIFFNALILPICEQ